MAFINLRIWPIEDNLLFPVLDVSEQVLEVFKDNPYVQQTNRIIQECRTMYEEDSYLLFPLNQLDQITLEPFQRATIGHSMQGFTDWDQATQKPVYNNGSERFLSFAFSHGYGDSPWNPAMWLRNILVVSHPETPVDEALAIAVLSPGPTAVKRLKPIESLAKFSNLSNISPGSATWSGLTGYRSEFVYGSYFGPPTTLGLIGYGIPHPKDFQDFWYHCSMLDGVIYNPGSIGKSRTDPGFFEIASADDFSNYFFDVDRVLIPPTFTKYFRDYLFFDYSSWHTGGNSPYSGTSTPYHVHWLTCYYNSYRHPVVVEDDDLYYGDNYNGPGYVLGNNYEWSGTDRIYIWRKDQNHVFKDVENENRPTSSQYSFTRNGRTVATQRHEKPGTFSRNPKTVYPFPRSSFQGGPYQNLWANGLVGSWYQNTPVQGFYGHTVSKGHTPGVWRGDLKPYPPNHYYVNDKWWYARALKCDVTWSIQTTIQTSNINPGFYDELEHEWTALEGPQTECEWIPIQDHKGPIRFAVFVDYVIEVTRYYDGGGTADVTDQYETDLPWRHWVIKPFNDFAKPGLEVVEIAQLFDNPLDFPIGYYMEGQSAIDFGTTADPTAPEMDYVSNKTYYYEAPATSGEGVYIEPSGDFGALVTVQSNPSDTFRPSDYWTGILHGTTFDYTPYVEEL